jgi:hypothetical protein
MCLARDEAFPLCRGKHLAEVTLAANAFIPLDVSIPTDQAILFFPV